MAGNLDHFLPVQDNKSNVRAGHELFNYLKLSNV